MALSEREQVTITEERIDAFVDEAKALGVDRVQMEEAIANLTFASRPSSDKDVLEKSVL